MNEEHRAQAALIKWCQLAGGQHPQLRRIFAIPNGGHRDPRVGARLKAEGVRPGVPDLFLPVAARSYHGLFIEMKIKPNSPTPAQFAEINALERGGYACVVCYSSEAAIEALKWYLSI